MVATYAIVVRRHDRIGRIGRPWLDRHLTPSLRSDTLIAHDTDVVVSRRSAPEGPAAWTSCEQTCPIGPSTQNGKFDDSFGG